MYSSRLAGSTVVLRVDAPAVSVVRLDVHDSTGRSVVRRRVRDRQVTLRLPQGSYAVTVADDRDGHDPARLAGGTTHLTVDDADVTATLTLTRGAVVTASSTRWAVVSAVHADGDVVETRADGRGRAVLAGLRAGGWTVVAHDRRRDRCSRVATLSVGAGDRVALDLPAATPTGRLLVQVGGTDRRPVRAGHVVATDAAGRTVTTPVNGGLADLRGLCPGPVRVEVPASVGHRGTTVDAVVEADVLGSLAVVVPVGASVSGRVVQGRGQYAAVVVLVDEDGTEVERARTGDDGRFEIGTGLGSRTGLTLVATSGPETLHVTRAAVADVDLVNGVRHDLGEIVLPVAGHPARWTARTAAVAGMKLPPTRL
jgi:hypothetical protein